MKNVKCFLCVCVCVLETYTTNHSDSKLKLTICSHKTRARCLINQCTIGVGFTTFTKMTILWYGTENCQEKKLNDFLGQQSRTMKGGFYGS